MNFAQLLGGRVPQGYRGSGAGVAEYCRRALTPEEQKFVDENPNHHLFHYTDVPVQEDTYVAGSAGTTKVDVVQIISLSVRVLEVIAGLAVFSLQGHRQASQRVRFCTQNSTP